MNEFHPNYMQALANWEVWARIAIGFVVGVMVGLLIGLIVRRKRRK